MKLTIPEKARLWRRHPRETAGSAALVLALGLLAGGSAWSNTGVDQVLAAETEKTAPAPPPLLIRNLAPTEAEALNGSLPLASGPNPPAKPFSVAKLDSATRANALECLAQAVYYEAGSESDDGNRAVAQVVLNRIRHPAFPASVCAVVYQGSTRDTGCQFTFTCDGSLNRQPDRAGWDRARKIAWAALNGSVFASVGNATHYHANYVVPYWAATLAKNAVVGAHLFYRWAGGWGKSAAFVQAYTGREESVHALRATALQAFAERGSKENAEEQLADIPGAEIEVVGNRQVKVRFQIDQARKAVEDSPKVAYVEKVAASDNLRWTLSGVRPDSAQQQPLGRAISEKVAN